MRLTLLTLLCVFWRPKSRRANIDEKGLCTYQFKSRGGGGGVRARGGDLMPETIPLSGFWSCEATPGSGHLTLTDRSLVSIQKRLPSPSLEAFWKSRCCMEKGMNPPPGVWYVAVFWNDYTFSGKQFDLLNKMRYILGVVALLGACDVSNNDHHLVRHLRFYQLN